MFVKTFRYLNATEKTNSYLRKLFVQKVTLELKETDVNCMFGTALSKDVRTSQSSLDSRSNITNIASARCKADATASRSYGGAVLPSAAPV